MTNANSATAVQDVPNSEYYSLSGRLPLASRLSQQARRKMFRLFMREIDPGEQTTVLDLGVTCEVHHKESNYFEQFYPHTRRIVCAGTEPAYHLEAAYPGTTFVQVKPGCRLPFADGQFDVVFSNAVVEHTGSRDAQREFIREVLRVGRRFFLTTPNRWFPVEMHTGMPLVHYLHPRVYRGLLRASGHEFYANEANLNLLDRKSLLSLFPASASVQVHRVRTLGITSNLIACGAS